MEHTTADTGASTDPEHTRSSAASATDTPATGASATGAPARPRRTPFSRWLPRRPRRARWSRAGAVRALVVLLAVVAPFAGAVVALTFAPPGHTQIAGAGVAVRPVLGQNTTRFQDGAIVRSEHSVVPGLGKAVGADITVDWNHLIPQDQQTRHYLGQLWADPDPAKDVLASTALRVVITWVAIGFGSVAVIEVGTWLVLRHRRRKLARYDESEAHLISAYNRRLRWTAAGVALVTLVALDVGGGVLWAHNDNEQVVGSPVFDGTALAGTQVDGLVADVVPFLSILQPRSAFYDQVASNLEQTLAGRTSLHASGDDVVFVTAEDFEDVNGMAQAVGRTADLVGADFIAYTGDLTFAGKPVESYIIDTLTYYANGIPIEFSPGLHDTDAIVGAAAARGWTVAGDTTHDVDGIGILTLADPRISTVGDFGVGDKLRSAGVDVPGFLSNAIQEACATQPTFIFLHDHDLGRQLAEQGCDRAAVIDGRSYDFVGPQRIPTKSGGTAVQFTQGSSGGHITTVPNPGRIKSPATFEIFDYNKATGALSYELVTVRPDASVSVSAPTPIDIPSKS